MSWIRENEGERACTDLFDVGSRLIHFRKFQECLSPGFPSLLGAVNVCSSKQCSCTPQIPARSLPAMLLKWMVIQIPALAAGCSQPPGEDKKRYYSGPGTWSLLLFLLRPCNNLSSHSRAQLFLEICQKPDLFST